MKLYIPELDWRIRFMFFFVKPGLRRPSLIAFSFFLDVLSYLNFGVKLGDKSDLSKEELNFALQVGPHFNYEERNSILYLLKVSWVR